jgi:two-component system, response regulator
MTSLILLVEDNPSDEKLAVLAFKRCGVAHEIVVVRDGAEALEYLFSTGQYSGRDPSTDPAVVLLDLKLPKIDGLDVLARIRSDPRTRLLRVVILTSSAEDDDLARGYALGANAYVRKPVEFSQFVRATKAMGSFWLELTVRLPRPGRVSS